jgi:hypothetical protein
MRWLAPKGVVEFLLCLFVLISFVATANVAFGLMLDDHPWHELSHYFLHDTFVGGPLIALFSCGLNLPNHITAQVVAVFTQRWADQPRQQAHLL